MKSLINVIVSAVILIAASNSTNAMIVYRGTPVNNAYPSVLLNMKASNFIKLSAKEFANSLHKKLTLRERIAFSVLKIDIRKQLKSHPDLTVQDYFAIAPDKGKILLFILIGILVIVVVVAIILIVTLGAITSGF